MYLKQLSKAVGWRGSEVLGSLRAMNRVLFSCCIRPHGVRTRCRVQARSLTCHHANFNFQVSCMARHDLVTQKRVEHRDLRERKREDDLPDEVVDD